MAQVNGTVKKVATKVIDRASLPQHLDAVDCIRRLAGCDAKDLVVELPRHQSEASGSEVYSLNGRVDMAGFSVQVSCNLTVIGTKTAK